jgi:G-patch domain
MSTGITVQSEFAKRQLVRMGWKEGNGLGKDRQGRAAPIIVKQRSDATGGLGIEKEKVRQVQQTIQDEWWKDALGDTLSKLCDKKEKKKKRKRGTITDSKNAEDSTNTERPKKKKVFTDEELFIATGGARFGMRAGKTRNQAKWRRTEELETDLVVQQQQQKNDNMVAYCTTTSISVEENQTTQTVECVNAVTQTVDKDKSSNKKSKSKKLRCRGEKSNRDKKADSKEKTKTDNVLLVEDAIKQPPEEEPLHNDCASTISANPLQQENRKKKKKKQSSTTE